MADFTNAGFETGDTTGWNPDVTETCTATVVSTPSPHAGTYSLKLDRTTIGYAWVYQNVSTTDTTLKFWLNVISKDEDADFFVTASDADDNTVTKNLSDLGYESGWTLADVSIATLTNRSSPVRFDFYIAGALLDEPGQITVLLDDVDLDSPGVIPAATLATATSMSGELHGTALALSATMATGTTITPLLHADKKLAATLATGTNLHSDAGSIGVPVQLAATMATSTTLTPKLSALLHFDNRQTLNFDTGSVAFTVGQTISSTTATYQFVSGSTEFTVGETITGATTGFHGVLLAYTVTFDDWGGGTATGTIQIAGQNGTFNYGEILNGSVSGNDCATAISRIALTTYSGVIESIVVESGTWGGGDAAGTLILTGVLGTVVNNATLTDGAGGAALVAGAAEYAGPYIVSWTVEKGIENPYGTATIVLDGVEAVTSCASYKDTELICKDHEGTDQSVFFGFVPDSGVQSDYDQDTTTVTAYDYGWYLANQRVPTEHLSSVTWDGTNEKITYYEPSVMVTYLLGGSLWQWTTGIYPLYIIPVPDWTVSTPAKGWAWDRTYTIFQAIKEMESYLNYVWGTYYYNGMYQAGYFCPLADIDTYSGAPAAVTFTGTTTNDYVMSIRVSRPGSIKYNRVRVIGNRNKRIINFKQGTVNFTAGTVVLDGTTGATATMIGSATVISGSWGAGTAAGYIIISYDRTASFCDGNNLSSVSESGAAVMNGNDQFYALYDVYEPAPKESDGVIGLDERPREYYETLDEECDSTSLIEARRDDLYTYHCNSDSNDYTVVLADRCDLRLWQKIKFIGYAQIPEEWMRITHIRYENTFEQGMLVTVTCQNDAYLTAGRRLRKSGVNTDADDIKKIVEALIEKKIKVGGCDILKVEGEGITIEMENGEVTTTSRSPTAL